LKPFFFLFRLVDLDFDTNSDTNSLPSINGDDNTTPNQQLLSAAKHQIKKYQSTQQQQQQQQHQKQAGSPTTRDG